MLEPIGPSSRAETIYRFVLFNPGLSIDEVAAATEVERAAVSGVAHELKELNLVTVTDDEHLNPVSPQVGLRDLCIQAEVGVADRQQQVDAARKAVELLILEYEQSRKVAMAEQIDGEDRVRDLACSMLDEIDAELSICFPPHVTWVRTCCSISSSPLFTRISTGKTRARVVHQQNDRALSTTTRRFTHSVSEAGGEVRLLPHVSAPLMLVDGAVVILSPPGDNHTVSAWRVTNPSIVKTTRVLFDLQWNAATPVSEPQQRNKDELTSLDFELLRLLSEGHTDKAVAAKLGIGLRTVGKRMAELCTMLGARSRFQAGVRAAQRGWLR
ncbi:helix-turn-helix transcriptional regulator [Phytoactinopolyspora limicola]|uniref:helix-turn-helix transcriptional regulator n=1 Tax=Phytoactinopolyspora limicola TaxID=2715536 RepID=UPI00140D8B4C|nr:helix-turn-helix transcriptional regulator [Phytoactinopolyspora limicola]